ncbi:MAG: lipid A deacylase LpxR family protein [Bacteroidetes bacterium]|nr:lipid A deacylase LpxR family protein [Bacteroidota bacterium]
MRKGCLKVISFLLCCMPALPATKTYAQKNNLQVLGISEDDDYLNFRGEGTDRGYSSGFELQLFYTKQVKPNFLGTLLIPMSGEADNLYSWGLTQHIYTPANIKSKEIEHGDRPYAGIAYISHALVSSDRNKEQRLTTSLSIGTIGKYSMAREIQTAYHQLVRYQVPEGWDNQIITDIIINYFVNYERILFKPDSRLEIIGHVQANTGTLFNNLGAGLQFRCGLFNNYFSNYEHPTYCPKNNGPHRKVQFFFYMKTSGVAVMDNATLQGGFFTHELSPYTITKDSVSRFYMEYEYGLVLANSHFGISAAEKLRTPEFKGSFAQQVGNITLYIGL